MIFFSKITPRVEFPADSLACENGWEFGDAPPFEASLDQLNLPSKENCDKEDRDDEFAHCSALQAINP